MINCWVYVHGQFTVFSPSLGYFSFFVPCFVDFRLLQGCSVQPLPPLLMLLVLLRQGGGKALFSPHLQPLGRRRRLTRWWRALAREDE